MISDRGSTNALMSIDRKKKCYKITRALIIQNRSIQNTCITMETQIFLPRIMEFMHNLPISQRVNGSTLTRTAEIISGLAIMLASQTTYVHACVRVRFNPIIAFVYETLIQHESTTARYVKILHTYAMYRRINIPGFT